MQNPRVAVIVRPGAMAEMWLMKISACMTRRGVGMPLYDNIVPLQKHVLQQFQ